MTPLDFVVWTFTIAACLIVGATGLAVAIAVVRGALEGKHRGTRNEGGHR